jgi:hypothetical protein
MSRTNAIPTDLITEFVSTLKALDVDAVEDVVGALEDIGVEDDNPPIKLSDLPKEVPEVIRQQIVEMSKQQIELGKRLNGMLLQLYQRSSAVYDRKEKEELAKWPKCECCHQLLKLKTRR